MINSSLPLALYKSLAMCSLTSSCGSFNWFDNVGIAFIPPWWHLVLTPVRLRRRDFGHKIVWRWWSPTSCSLATETSAKSSQWTLCWPNGQSAGAIVSCGRWLHEGYMVIVWAGDDEHLKLIWLVKSWTLYNFVLTSSNFRQIEVKYCRPSTKD